MICYVAGNPEIVFDDWGLFSYDRSRKQFVLCELAAPGKEFEIYSENRFKRKK